MQRWTVEVAANFDTKKTEAILLTRSRKRGKRGIKLGEKTFHFNEQWFGEWRTRISCIRPIIMFQVRKSVLRRGRSAHLRSDAQSTEPPSRTEVAMTTVLANNMYSINQVCFAVATMIG